MSSISPIQGVLAQLQQVSQAASAGSSPITEHGSTVRTGGFAAEMSKALKEVSGAQMHAAKMQQHFILGDKNVQLNDVMLDMQKASIGFQAAVQVRNKLVTAYQTIASMPL